MSEETPAVIQWFHDALNSHDIDELAPLVHQQCLFETTDLRLREGVAPDSSASADDHFRCS